MCENQETDVTHVWRSDVDDNVTTMFDVYAERAAQKGIAGLMEWMMTGRVR